MSLIASEITREKLFLFVHEEVPYLSVVETDSWKSNKNKSITVEQTIYVGRKNHVGIVLGKGGKMIKSIGIASRLDLEKVVGEKVHLKINVKFKKNWTDNEEDIINAAKVALSSGADSITAHLREDRRHIKDLDIEKIA